MYHEAQHALVQFRLRHRVRNIRTNDSVVVDWVAELGLGLEEQEDVSVRQSPLLPFHAHDLSSAIAQHAFAEVRQHLLQLQLENSGDDVVALRGALVATCFQLLRISQYRATIFHCSECNWNGHLNMGKKIKLAM